MSKPITEGAMEVFNPEIGTKCDDFVKTVIHEVNEGNVNAEQVWIIAKKMAKIGEKLTKSEELKEATMKEVDKYTGGKGGAVVTIYGAKISVVGGKPSYNYSECGHPVWDALDEIEKKVKARKKIIEDELKKLNAKVQSEYESGEINQYEKGIGTADDTILIKKMPELVWKESGEVVDITAPKKFQKQGLRTANI